MKMQKLNLFIVDDNPLIATGLRNYLITRFGSALDITTFYTGETALQKISANTSIVVLDYCLEGENGNEVLKSIKKLNPETEVIMLSTNENIGGQIDSYRKRAASYANKSRNSWKLKAPLTYRFFTYPARKLVTEFGINKYLAMFLTTFVAMGIGVFFALRFIN